ncbi:DNA-3-methyladenine glycosylase family protein [Haloplanus aerogenes]|uniref:DNA-3-methyladenine glycosylase 2 family protein n=1 Tax=Haloplanus aerogenes TaxID=660522 RepID=A0A3M0CUU3_9EURY|nr:DNA-3-methyladenine glycosylase [Haloplanus aerogenes]AZH26507.1 DNA-3-methyladenine glycosylase 2 family protein [Haloplanus aerogenes]RMB12735.1 DNA-3-methyladenine glycosylase II [Haloplanus aerogenes]
MTTTTDPHAVLRTDPVMADLIETHGRLTLQPAEDEFRRLVVSIVNQQLSTASADAIRERLFDHLDAVTPATVLAADRDALRDTGLSGTKVDYLRNAATAFRDRDLTREGLTDSDDEAVIDELTAITGIGRWTAEMYLIFVLGREDVLPLGDLAIRRGLESLYDCDSRDEMRAAAEPWRPYRSYGTLYVWEHYES